MILIIIVMNVTLLAWYVEFKELVKLVFQELSFKEDFAFRIVLSMNGS
jgi:hypothetical protein